jgi:hypothetical protein
VQWGFDELLAKQLSDTAFVFYLVGILTSLRAVQHALKNADSALSDEHKRVIDEWWRATQPSTPELHFIRTSRNLILKAGAFPAFAITQNSSRRPRHEQERAERERQHKRDMASARHGSRRPLFVSPDSHFTVAALFFFGHVAYAYPPGRLHRAVPAHQSRDTALRRSLAARD